MLLGLYSVALDWTQSRSSLATSSLYLDALRLRYHRCTLNRHFQNAVLKPSTNLALIGALRQAKAAAERSVAVLPYVIAAALLLLLLGLALTRDGQYVLMQRNIHILGLNAWQLGSDDQVSILGSCVYCAPGLVGSTVELP